MKFRRLSLLLIGWNLIGYPLLVAFLARRARPFEPGNDLPIRNVSVLVAAYNEEREIGHRVDNIRANDPSAEIIVISDGSDDLTASIAEAAGARVIEQSRSGKIAALHRGIGAASGDVIVITDANTVFLPDAIRNLIRPLSDPRVGIAAGDLILEQGPAPSAEGEGAYWKYETWIKKNASRAGLLLMGAGGIYALRREDWPRHLPDDLADDSYVPLSLARMGRRNIFVEDAKAVERSAASMNEEWRRRVRMVAQDVRVARSLAFGLPSGRIFFALVSHKVLRWLLFPLAAVAFKPRAWMLLGIFGAGKPSFLYLAGATASASWGMLLGLFGKSSAAWEKAESTRR